jgi:CubicO group peptidase (beta-lactamase class C family)
MYGAQRLFDHGNRLVPIRSVTKALTAATFMALTEQNIIGLDEFAADYVPAFKQGKLAEITFRMLMSHTAGFPMIIDEGQALLNPEITLMQSATLIAKTYPLQFRSGQGFMYTEIGFQVVGAAMEAVTGRSLQSLVKHYITGPIGMNDTQVSTASSRLSAVQVRYTNAQYKTSQDMPQLCHSTWIAQWCCE